VDWGGRRLGLARSDALGLTAQPLDPVILPTQKGDAAAAAHRAQRDAVAAIVDAVVTHEIGRVVIGLPLDLSGHAGEAAVRVQALVAALVPALPADVPVETWDERMTSALAERSLREEGWTAGTRKGGGRERTRSKGDERARIDQRAALLLLQSWLDAHPQGGGAGERA